MTVSLLPFRRSVLSAICILTLAGVVRAEDIRIACIGDSITEGALGDNSTANAYPAALDRLMGEGYNVRNFGVSGTTLLRKGDFPYWKTPQYRNATNFAPNIVVIKLGTNDSKQQNWKFKDEFGVNLREMVDVFTDLPSKPQIWLCLPVPAYAVVFGIRPEVIQYEVIPLIKEVAKEKHLPVIDLFTALSGRPELLPDQIHPDAAGAALLAKTVHAALAGAR